MKYALDQIMMLAESITYFYKVLFQDSFTPLQMLAPVRSIADRFPLIQLRRKLAEMHDKHCYP